MKFRLTYVIQVLAMLFLRVEGQLLEFSDGGVTILGMRFNLLPDLEDFINIITFRPIQAAWVQVFGDEETLLPSTQQPPTPPVAPTINPPPNEPTPPSPTSPAPTPPAPTPPTPTPPAPTPPTPTPPAPTPPTPTPPAPTPPAPTPPAPTPPAPTPPAPTPPAPTPPAPTPPAPTPPAPTPSPSTSTPNEVWVSSGNIDGSLSPNAIGTAMSLNQSGNRLALGGMGNLFIFDATSNGWNLAADLSDKFSSWIASIDMSSDGNFFVASQTSEDVTNPNFNAATDYIVKAFKNVGDNWAQTGPTLSGNQGDGFGASVAISEDGEKVVVGAPQGNYVEVIFLIIGLEWTLKLDGAEENSFFGAALSLAGDDRFLAVGAPRAANFKGSAYIIDTNQRIITQTLQGEIGGVNNGDYFGSTLAFSKDRSTLAVGSRGKSAQTFTDVFLYNADVDQYEKRHTVVDVGERLSGWSLALSSDGKRLVIGMPYNDDAGGNAGQTSIFAIENENMVNVGFFAGEAQQKEGSAVAISGDGSAVATGSIGNPNIPVRSWSANSV